MVMMNRSVLVLLVAALVVVVATGFELSWSSSSLPPSLKRQESSCPVGSSDLPIATTVTTTAPRADCTRREWLCLIGTGAAAAASVIVVRPANADFTPGGTLVDRKIGVTVGNPEASISRKIDNSNVLFDKDYYFKFGTAAIWIEPDTTEFPKTMPFTKVQQRYDALKKYRDRILSGLDKIQSLADVSSNTDADIPDPTAADVYQLRPMGLMANAFLASENTGTTNELFLARWYINEMYLLIGDLRRAADSESNTTASEKKKIYTSLVKATNSYLSMLNRVITPKVGDKFEYLKI